MRADAKANRQDIVTTAWRLFGEQGADVSLRAIATEAGVGIATLCRHFPSREALIDGVVAEAATRVTGVATAAIESWSSDASRAWRRFIENLSALQIGNLGIQLTPALGNLDELSAETREIREHSLTNLDSVVQLAKDDGFVRPDTTTIQFLVGLGILTRPFPELAAPDLTVERSWLIDVYMRGLRPEK